MNSKIINLGDIFETAMHKSYGLYRKIFYGRN
jgi:hypothetical protein